MLEIDASPLNFALLIGLGFFLGLAFEESYREGIPRAPGGIRSFPLLAIAGAAAFLIEPEFGLIFAVGLAVLGAWMFAFYRARLAREEGHEDPGSGLVVPVCNVLAYILGPIVLTQPLWIAVGVTVAAALLLGARSRLHAFARRVPSSEIVTAAKFLILAGIILPLLPDEPLTSLTSITPYQAWLAVVAVSALSYAGYLLERVMSGRGGVLTMAILGGAYSSTSTTVSLARRFAVDPAHRASCQAGIVAASTVMFVRIALIVAAFDLSLAAVLVPMLLPVFVLGALASYALVRRDDGVQSAAPRSIRNPLELSAALVFATLFVAVSVAIGWLQSRYGASGMLALSALTGVIDVDPLVLNVAQSGSSGEGYASRVAAILVVASTNNLVKATYAFVFASPARPIAAIAALAAMGIGGFALAWAALHALP
jgi:uncharacterized membrane protein (DUF4010 family)